MVETTSKNTKNKDMQQGADSGFVDTVVSVNRVTKVTKGGKRFTFSAFVVSGDQQGKVGLGLGKSREVSSAITKATTRARKNMISVSLRDATIPYDVEGYHGATRVVIRSAYKGTGLIAGGHVRAVAKALGIKDILAKVVGPSRCGQNVVKATLNALAKCRTINRIAQLRSKTVSEITKGSHGRAS